MNGTMASSRRCGSFDPRTPTSMNPGLQKMSDNPYCCSKTNVRSDSNNVRFHCPNFFTIVMPKIVGCIIINEMYVLNRRVQE